MKVFAADPGGTTGWAQWDSLIGTPTAGQLEFEDFIDFFEDWVVPPDVIVAERFTINQQTIRHSQQTTALEVIGYLRACAHRDKIPFVLQTPADAKRFATDARLDTLGWTQRPKAQHDHANDALRHLMLYLVKQRIIEPPRVS